VRKTLHFSVRRERIGSWKLAITSISFDASSAVKNQQRWNFGVISPESYATAQRGNDKSAMRTQPGHRFFFSVEEVEPYQRQRRGI